jgi:hypothetical protein
VPRRRSRRSARGGSSARRIRTPRDGGDLDKHFIARPATEPAGPRSRGCGLGHHAGPHGAPGWGAGSGCGHVNVSFRTARARWRIGRWWQIQ